MIGTERFELRLHKKARRGLKYLAADEGSSMASVVLKALDEYARVRGYPEDWFKTEYKEEDK